MTKLALSDALGLNAEKLKKQKLLGGNKLRGLIMLVREEMRKYSSNSSNVTPQTWVALEKDLERIDKEIKTTFREKAYAKLGMQISAIANEVAKVTDNPISNEGTTDIALEVTDIHKKARSELLRQANDMKKYYVGKDDRTGILDKIDVVINAVHSAKSEQELAECKKNLLATAWPTKSQISLGAVELGTAADEMLLELDVLKKNHQKRPYAWRADQVDTNASAVEKYCAEVKSKPAIEEKTYAHNLAKIHLVKLGQILPLLSVPATLAECNTQKGAIDGFVTKLKGLKTKVLLPFTKKEDKDEIERVLTDAVRDALIPLEGLLKLLDRVIELHANCSTEKESQLNALCLAVTSNIETCLQHVANDTLLADWDACPAKDEAKSVLTDALNSLSKQFKVT